MGVRCVTYGGRIGWFLRKHFSYITSDAYLNMQYMLRRKLFREYIQWFELHSMDNIPLPCLVSIETINRCNSTCGFCPVNRNADKRPFAKMSEELFRSIIGQLKDWNYDGWLNLYVNNEPLIDKRIEERYEFAKKELPKAKMLLYTNGTLMTWKRFQRLAAVIDKMIINNYTNRLKLHRNIEDIYKKAKKDPYFNSKDITIQIRYINEILTNRAGEAPNKKEPIRKFHRECIMPFTDITIYPDGTFGLCCNDALEKTSLGVFSEKNSIPDIWRSDNYQSLRQLIGKDREKYSFCSGCDFFDAGIRNDFLRERMKNRNIN